MNLIKANLVFFLICFLLVAGTPFSYAGLGTGGDKDNPETDSKDTVKAIVLYGNNFLIDPARYFSEEEIMNYIDSVNTIKTTPKEVLNQINTFLSVKEKTDDEIYLMIDSIFELEKVPYALINQINYYVATRSNISDEDINSVAITSFYDNSEYPAHCFYNSWDITNTHPYSEALCSSDTTLTLVLQDTVNFCNYIHPHDGVVTSKFGWRDSRNHSGIDIDLRTGDPVVSAFDGMVRIARKHGGYGNVVVVRHYNGLETLYAHLSKMKVKPGQLVNAGQLVGLGGNTGKSTGSHLHFEVRFKGKPLNPSHIISFKNQTLFSDAVVLNKSKWSYNAYPEGTEIHTVQKREYLQLVAQRYGITIKELCELNGISRKSYLRVGQKLRITS